MSRPRTDWYGPATSAPTYLVRFTQFLEHSGDDSGPIVAPVVASKFAPQVI
jgi:hypothetical protein